MKNISIKVILPQIVLAVLCILSAVWSINSTRRLKTVSLEVSRKILLQSIRWILCQVIFR